MNKDLGMCGPVSNYDLKELEETIKEEAKKTGELTREQIKWTSRMAIFTGIMAGATLLLAIATFLK